MEKVSALSRLLMSLIVCVCAIILAPLMELALQELDKMNRRLMP